MIELHNVQKNYGTPILKEISVKFEKGKVTGIKGASGSGKSTLFKLIAGLESCDAGEIRIGGEIVSSSEVFIAPHLRGIGYGFQNNALWPHLKVWQQVALPLGGLGTNQKKNAMELLEELNISELANRLPLKISGGQAKRVSLARAFAADPAVVLLDEPLVHLDFETREKLCGWIRKRTAEKGITLILASHEEEELKTLCQNRYSLLEGRLVQDENL